MVGLPPSIIYTWAERGTVRVKCPSQELNAVSPARARTRTARSGDERTNHEATTPPASRSDIPVVPVVRRYVYALIVTPWASCLKPVYTNLAQI